MPKILIVEDDANLCQVLKAGLQADGHTVDVAQHGDEALSSLQQYGYDLIVLDWELPFISGVELCERFRAHGGHTPIIMLTAKAKLEDKETGFDVGVDDYLTKPFELRELKSRVKALLRRPKQIVATTLELGHLKLELESRQAMKEGVGIHLSRKEFELLEFFMRRPGVTHSAERLLAAIWASDKSVGTETVRQHIKNLRAKIDREGAPSAIVTVFAQGYRLDVQP